MSVFVAGSLALSLVAGGPNIISSEAFQELHKTIVLSHKEVKSDILTNINKEKTSVLSVDSMNHIDIQSQRNVRLLR